MRRPEASGNFLRNAWMSWPRPPAASTSNVSLIVQSKPSMTRSFTGNHSSQLGRLPLSASYCRRLNALGPGRPRPRAIRGSFRHNWMVRPLRLQGSCIRSVGGILEFWLRAVIQKVPPCLPSYIPCFSEDLSFAYQGRDRNMVIVLVFRGWYITVNFFLFPACSFLFSVSLFDSFRHYELEVSSSYNADPFVHTRCLTSLASWIGHDGCRNQEKDILIVSWIFCAFAVISVTARIFSRVVLTQNTGWDDVFIVISLVHLLSFKFDGN